MERVEAYQCGNNRGADDDVGGHLGGSREGREKDKGDYGESDPASQNDASTKAGGQNASKRGGGENDA